MIFPSPETVSYRAPLSLISMVQLVTSFCSMPRIDVHFVFEDGEKPEGHTDDHEVIDLRYANSILCFRAPYL